MFSVRPEQREQWIDDGNPDCSETFPLLIREHDGERASHNQNGLNTDLVIGLMPDQLN